MMTYRPKLMLFVVCWLLACSCINSTRPSFAQESGDENSNDGRRELATIVDAYLDERYSGTTDATESLTQNLTDKGVSDPEDLEGLLRGRRAGYPDASGWIGRTTVHEVECQHVDYATRYFLFVPEELEFDQPVSLVIVGHGGNSSMSSNRAEATARAYLEEYKTLGKPMNGVIVAPASSRGWGQIGNSLMFSVVSDVQRMLPIDPDLIYVTGQSMGGHLSYRTALTFPDRFAAVSPHSGGYDYVEKKAIGNLINIPGYSVWGTREPYGINKDNRTNQAWAKSHQLDWKFVEKDGGHVIYNDELPNVATFFTEHPRNLYRDSVYLRSGGAMKFVNTWGIKGWPEHEIYVDSKPLRWNMRHWIQVEPRPDLKEPLELLAVNSGNNRIEITSSNVRNLTVFLHPKMVDWQQPVTIIINDQQQLHERVETDPRLMFELAREFDDRGRVFFARVDLEVETDQQVVMPGK